MGKRGKAQIVGHPIVAIFLLVGFIMLLIIGFKIYNSIIENQCKSTLVSWESNLKNDVMEIALREGSVRQRAYTELCGADAVYFIDSNRNIPQDAFNNSIEIQNHIFGKTGKNLFLIKKKRLFASLFIGDLHLEHPYYICFNTTATRKLDLLIMGKGNSADITHLENNKGTTYDCTDYSLPREIEVKPSLDKASSILANSSIYLERTFSLSPQEAIKRYNETSEKVEIDREFQKLNTSTRIKIKIRSKSSKIIDNFIYIEDIPKACLSYLSDYSIEVENGEVVTYDPVIAWHFADIGTKGEASYIITDAELESKCKDLIDGVGLAENFVDNINEIKNDPPILSIPDITLAEDSNLSMDLSNFIADPDNIKKDIRLTNAKSVNMNILLNNFSLTITPNPNWYGEERIAFTAFDNYNTTIQEVLIRITSVNDMPIIISEPKTNAVQYQEYKYKVIANDIEKDPIAFSLMNYPVGMSIDANGNIAWTPAKSGVYNIKIQVADINDAKSFQEYSLTVQQVNNPPTIAKIPAVKVNGSLGLKDNVVPNLWIFAADDTDPKNLEYSVSSQSNPDLISCFVDSKKNLDCNVKNNDDGYSDVTIQVNDGEFSSYTTLRVTVKKYVPPAATPEPQQPASQVQPPQQPAQQQAQVPQQSQTPQPTLVQPTPTPAPVPQPECKPTYTQDCEGNDVYMYNSCSGEKVIKKKCSNLTCKHGKCCYEKKFLWFKWWICI